MCRMFAYYGSSRERLLTLMDCLRQAARRDVLIPGGAGSHDDGWGMVILTKEGVLHYRSGKPVFEDQVEIPRFHGEVMAIVHARKAADGQPVGSHFSHPFVESNDRFTLYMAHNGTVRKEELGNIMLAQFGVKLDVGQLVDTEVALKFVMAKGDLQEAVRELMGYTKTALNLFLLKVQRSRQASLLYLSHYNADYPKSRGLSEEDYRRYVDLYLSQEEGLTIASSTVAHYCGGSWSIAERGRLRELAWAELG
jgi:predicted glutamine amidotransferase